MYDVIVIGAGIAGATFAFKISKYAKTLLIEARERKNLPVSTNIFPEHNRQFLRDDEIEYSNKVAFPCIFHKINYMGQKDFGIIDSAEFGENFGYITHTEKLIDYLLQKVEDQGGTLKFNEKISQISRHSDKIEVISNEGQSYNAKLLAIATGSHNQELQKSLGFETPDKFMGIYTHLYGNESQLKENLPTDYTFHLNPNISHDGPLFIIRGSGRLSVGFLGKKGDTQEILIDKLDRILKNYKHIQPFIKGLKRGDAQPTFGEISKHPISRFSQDRTIVLGEAAGLVTALFYEGILGGIASADIATSTLKPLIQKNSNFTQTELSNYDKEIHRILLDKYFKTGLASEYLFYRSGSKLKLLWEIYCNFIKTNKTLRKYIWEAIRRYDLENHDIDRDRWTGEELFKRLPLLNKATYWPHFLKAMIK